MKITDVINFKDVNKSYHWNKHLLTKDKSELKVVVLFTNAYGDCYQPSTYWRDLHECEPYKHTGSVPLCVSSHHNIQGQVERFDRLISDIEDDDKLIYITNEIALLDNDLVRPDCCMIVRYNGEKIETRPFYKTLVNNTGKEVRFEHNLLKMYLSGDFDWNYT